ncbi:hypothetical protein IW261DRAFT_1422875 [Armillaria novae-zelandiae]|uniref:Uncharacterized protein n=1 Tax=Armillaria novae-zelandiae TaxID=153914 RepID=A0AA39T9S5_9AGAR|nr:hypothetical protein IW261DRAFT_1422875 [Armillaria novae-zelandiae]
MAHNQPKTGALPVNNPLFTFRSSTLVTAHNQNSVAITPQEIGALRGGRVSQNNPSMLGSLDDQGGFDPPAPKVHLVDAYHLSGQNILQCTWVNASNVIQRRDNHISFLQCRLNAGEAVDADVDMDHESQMVEQILQFEGKNLDLKGMNASYLKQLREQEHLIKQQNETLKDEREFFQRKLESLEASMNKKMASMRSEQAKLERGLIEKCNSVLALRSSLMATPSNHSKTRTVAVNAHHINLPIINIAPDSEASSRAASTSKLTSTSVAVSADQPITRLTGPAAPTIAPASIPGRIQTPIPVLVTGQTHTVGAPPPVFATPTPTKRPPPVTITTNTSSMVPAMQQSNIIVNTSLPAPGTSMLAHPLPDQLEGIKFSNPDIPSSAVINALTLLMNAMKTSKTSVEGHRVSRKPGTWDHWIQVKRAGKLQLTHAQELCYNALVQEVWREVFNVERLNDFISYTPVDPEEFVSYNLDNGDGPDKHFTLDFSEGWRRSNWNTTILNKIKFQRQTGVVTNVIALKTESNTPNLQHWNLLKKILEQLGHHRMSPEELSTQMSNGMTMQVFIQLCKWRVPQVTEHLKLIDNMGKLPALQGQKASQPTERVWSDADYNGRVPPGLPRAMYNDAWLKDLSRASVEELQISEEAFEFLNLAVQNL